MSTFFVCVADINTIQDCSDIRQFADSLQRPSPRGVFASLSTDSQSDIVSLPDHVLKLACSTGGGVDFSYTVMFCDDDDGN